MKEYCFRKFGKTEISIDYKGKIKISTDWNTNFGLIYSHMIEIFKTGKINPITGLRYQVIGMDSEVAETHLNWIYSKVEKGFFDHLIGD